MLKHLHSAHRRSLSFLSDSSISSSSIALPSDPTLTNYTPTLEAPKKQHTRKYSTRSVKHRKAAHLEGGVSQKVKQRNASGRVKANSVYSESPSTNEYQRKQPAEVTSYDHSKLNISRMRKFMHHHSQKPVSLWSTEDACDWLKSTQLDDDNQLSEQFRKSRVCGRHLADAETAWNCLNRLSFQNSRQRQDVVLKLAEYLRESKTANTHQSSNNQFDSDTKHPKSRLRLRPPSSIGYQDATATSSDYVSGTSSSSSITNSTAIPENEQGSTYGDLSASSVSTSSSRVKKTLSTIRQAISKSKALPISPTETGLLHDIVIHSNITSPDCFAATQLKITDTTTTSELVQLFVDSSSINEDINLFVINDVSVPDPDVKVEKKHRNRGVMSSRRMLEPDECPLAVYKSITTSTRRNVTRRLELIQMKGVIIKVICRIGKHRPRGKQFRISTQSSVDHVIRLALRKFRLRNVDSSLFALCDISVSGDFSEFSESRLPQWKNGASLLMCDRATLKQLNSQSGAATNQIPDFRRSCSMTSNLSAESRGSSGSDSWTPYKLDQTGRLTDELMEQEREYLTRVQNSISDDVIVDDVSPLTNDDIGKSAELTHFHQRSGSCNASGAVSIEHQKAEALTVDNAVLRSQLREKVDQFDDIHRKVTQVRNMLESGLQRYHDSVNQQSENANGGSLALEEEIKSTEKMISSTEDMLGQLFRHQRQLLSKQKVENSSQSDSDEQINYSAGNLDLEGVDSASLADVDLQIAVHQADLLSLKHKHQLLDTKMSLFVAQRKAEKFRHMIHSSLYDIVSSNSGVTTVQSNQPQTQIRPGQAIVGYTIHCCEVFSSNAGYGLALKDELETTRTSAMVRGTIMDCEHRQGALRKGDRLLEINGINVQSVGAEHVARILKGTTTARIVVMRKRDSTECNRCLLDLPANKSQPASPSTRSEDTDDDDVIMKEFDATSKPVVAGSEEMADWREMSALKSDLSMLMRELELTSRAKRELERDVARKRNRDVLLESENARLREQIIRLQKAVRTGESDSA